MTEATLRALEGLRDLSAIKWYAVTLLMIVLYVYGREIRQARQTGNWDAVFSALAVFGVDFFNETWNGWVMHLTEYSAFWTVPGDTALRTMVGWNLEIMFMFSLMGFVFYYSLSESTTEKILGIPEKWFFAVLLAATAVFVECILNLGGHLVWAYPFWNLSFKGVWLIFLIGYFHFFAAAIWVITRRTMKAKIAILGFIYCVPIGMNILAFGLLGFYY